MKIEIDLLVRRLRTSERLNKGHGVMDERTLGVFERLVVRCQIKKVKACGW